MAAAAPSAPPCSLPSPSSPQRHDSLHALRLRVTPSPSPSVSAFAASRIRRWASPSPAHVGFWWASSSTSSACQAAADGPSNTAPTADPSSQSHHHGEVTTGHTKQSSCSKEPTVSSFMEDVSSLIKIVDSRDIVELELRHSDIEIVIRKKELPPLPLHAVAQFSARPPQVIQQTPHPPHAPLALLPATPSQLAPHVPPPLPPPPPISSPPAFEHPTMLSPMAGTFYRSPAPGEPHFVEVGDKVQRGQVVCIVEAMKLMNEIEADQSGTVVDILAADGKPVSVNTPLFLIKP